MRGARICLFDFWLLKYYVNLESSDYRLNFVGDLIMLI